MYIYIKISQIAPHDVRVTLPHCLLAHYLDDPPAAVSRVKVQSRRGRKPPSSLAPRGQWNHGPINGV